MSLLCDFPRYQAQLDYWLAKIQRYEVRERNTPEQEKKTIYHDMIVRLMAKVADLQEQARRQRPMV